MNNSLNKLFTNLKIVLKNIKISKKSFKHTTLLSEYNFYGKIVCSGFY